MASDLEEILQKFVPKKLYDELRRDYDRLLVRLGRMEEQLLMLSEYRLEPEESVDVIDRKIRRAEKSRRRRMRDLERESGPRKEREDEPRSAERERRRAAGPEGRKRPDLATELEDSLAEESTDDLIRRLRERYRDIGRLRERLRDEEE